MGRAAVVPAHYSLPPCHLLNVLKMRCCRSLLDRNGREVSTRSFLFLPGENPGLEAEVLWVVDVGSKDLESLN